MSLFFESIRVVNGRPMNLKFHQARIDRTLATSGHQINLKALWEETVKPERGVYKWRVSYNKELNQAPQVSLSPYLQKEIKSLKLIEVGDSTYLFKSEDRTFIERAFAQKKNNDDVLLLRNGFISDTSYCNIALWDGESWWTPEDSLLQGTMQAKLIALGIIRSKKIHHTSIIQYKKMRLFNAMIPWSNKKDIIIDKQLLH